MQSYRVVVNNRSIKIYSDQSDKTRVVKLEANFDYHKEEVGKALYRLYRQDKELLKEIQDEVNGK